VPGPLAGRTADGRGSTVGVAPRTTRHGAVVWVRPGTASDTSPSGASSLYGLTHPRPGPAATVSGLSGHPGRRGWPVRDSGVSLGVGNRASGLRRLAGRIRRLRRPAVRLRTPRCRGHPRTAGGLRPRSLRGLPAVGSRRLRPLRPPVRCHRGGSARRQPQAHPPPRGLGPDGTGRAPGGDRLRRGRPPRRVDLCRHRLAKLTVAVDDDRPLVRTLPASRDFDFPLAATLWY